MQVNPLKKLIRIVFCSISLQIIFLADLVNCHVITPSSFILFIEEIIVAALEQNIPQVSHQFLL